MEGSSYQPFQKILRFGTINFSDYQDLEVPSFQNADVLSQEVQNLALKDSVNGNKNVEVGPVVSKDAKHKKEKYPVRPKVNNCLYFMKYGWCKFGFNCRYRHPFIRLIQVPLEYHDAPIYTTAEWSQPIAAELPMKTLSADAKAYQHMNQPSKFGIGFQPLRTSSCPLNDKGLPLRPDMEVCTFYSRYGVCKMGPACRFDHPATLRMVVPAAGSEDAAGSEEAWVPAAGSQDAQGPPAQLSQLPDPTTEDEA